MRGGRQSEIRLCNRRRGPLDRNSTDAPDNDNHLLKPLYSVAGLGIISLSRKPIWMSHTRTRWTEEVERQIGESDGKGL